MMSGIPAAHQQILWILWVPWSLVNWWHVRAPCSGNQDDFELVSGAHYINYRQTGHTVGLAYTRSQHEPAHISNSSAIIRTGDSFCNTNTGTLSEPHNNVPNWRIGSRTRKLYPGKRPKLVAASCLAALTLVWAQTCVNCQKHHPSSLA
jgi:hypothetical protein